MGRRSRAKTRIYPAEEHPIILKSVARLALITLSLTSVVLAVSGLGEEGLKHWYLFFSPLLLAAYFYGLRDSIVISTGTFASLMLLHRNVALNYQASLASTRPDLDSLVGDITELSKQMPPSHYLGVAAGAGVLVLGAMVVGLLIDQQRQHETRIQVILSQDSLAGLLNHQHFIHTLRYWGKESSSKEKSLELIIFGLDRFGALQERYGHFSGDLVLERIGLLLAHLEEHGYAVARLGSDEFGLAHPGVSPTELQATAQALQAALREYDWTGHAGRREPGDRKAHG